MNVITRCLITTALVVFSLLVFPYSVQAEPTGNAAPFSWEEGINSLDLGEMENFKNHIDGELSAYLNKTSLREWFGDFISGQWKFNTGEVLNNLLRFFVKEIAANSGLLGKLIILAVVTSLLVNLQSAFGGEGVSRLSYLVCFLALLAIALGSFRYVLKIGHQTIDSMTDFMLGVLPQMMILVAGMGGINTSAAIFPIMMTASTAFAHAIQHVVFPLIILSAVLSLLNIASDTVKVQRLGKLLSSLAAISLGLFMTVFVGLLGLKTVYGAILDEVTLKTTQFATSLFPIIGKLLSDALEFALGYMAILKHALSIFGLVIVFGICIFPIIKIGAIVLIYKLSAALVEPLGDSRTAEALEVMAKHLVLVMASVAAVALMFFIMMAIVAGATNQAAFFR